MSGDGGGGGGSSGDNTPIAGSSPVLGAASTTPLYSGARVEAASAKAAAATGKLLPPPHAPSLSSSLASGAAATAAASNKGNRLRRGFLSRILGGGSSSSAAAATAAAAAEAAAVTAGSPSSTPSAVTSGRRASASAASGVAGGLSQLQHQRSFRGAGGLPSPLALPPPTASSPFSPAADAPYDGDGADRGGGGGGVRGASFSAPAVGFRDPSVLGIPSDAAPLYALPPAVFFVSTVCARMLPPATPLANVLTAAATTAATAGEHTSTSGGGGGATVPATSVSSATAAAGCVGGVGITTSDRASVSDGPNNSGGNSGSGGGGSLLDSFSSSWLLCTASGTPDTVAQSICRELGPCGLLYLGVWTSLLSIAARDPASEVAAAAQKLVRRVWLKALFVVDAEAKGALPSPPPSAPSLPPMLLAGYGGGLGGSAASSRRQSSATTGAAATSSTLAMDAGVGATPLIVHAASSSDTAAATGDTPSDGYGGAATSSDPRQSSPSLLIAVYDAQMVQYSTALAAHASASSHYAEECLSRWSSPAWAAPSPSSLGLLSLTPALACVRFHRPSMLPLAPSDDADPLSVSSLQRAGRQRALVGALSEATTLALVTYDDGMAREVIQSAGNLWARLCRRVTALRLAEIAAERAQAAEAARVPGGSFALVARGHRHQQQQQQHHQHPYKQQGRGGMSPPRAGAQSSDGRGLMHPSPPRHTQRPSSTTGSTSSFAAAPSQSAGVVAHDTTAALPASLHPSSASFPHIAVPTTFTIELPTGTAIGGGGTAPRSFAVSTPQPQQPLLLQPQQPHMGLLEGPSVVPDAAASTASSLASASSSFSQRGAAGQLMKQQLEQQAAQQAQEQQHQHHRAGSGSVAVGPPPPHTLAHSSAPLVGPLQLGRAGAADLSVGGPAGSSPMASTSYIGGIIPATPATAGGAAHAAFPPLLLGAGAMGGGASTGWRDRGGSGFCAPFATTGRSTSSSSVMIGGQGALQQPLSARHPRTAALQNGGTPSNLGVGGGGVTWGAQPSAASGSGVSVGGGGGSPMLRALAAHRTERVLSEFEHSAPSVTLDARMSAALQRFVK